MAKEKEKLTDEQKASPVTYLAHEADMSRLERANRRWFILCLVLLILLAASWIGFFVYDSQFEDVSVSQDVDTGDGDAILAGYGDVYYGEGETNGQGAP